MIVIVRDRIRDAMKKGMTSIKSRPRD